MKITARYYRVGFIPGMQGSLNILKINQQISPFQAEKRDIKILSKDAVKSLGKTEQLITIKTPSQSEIE